MLPRCRLELRAEQPGAAPADQPLRATLKAYPVCDPALEPLLMVPLAVCPTCRIDASWDVCVQVDGASSGLARPLRLWVRVPDHFTP